MAALAYRDDKILARNLLLRPFFCLTPAEPFFRPDRSTTAPSCRVAVKDGRAFRGHPKGLSLTAASTMARWQYRSGRRPCVAAEHVSSPRRSSRIPGSRSRSLYRSPGTPIGKSIDYLDFATIKPPAPAYSHVDGDFELWCRAHDTLHSTEPGFPLSSRTCVNGLAFQAFAQDICEAPTTR